MGRNHVRLSAGCWAGLALLPIILPNGFAADATFSKDGGHVYAIEFEKSRLFDIDIAKESASRIDLGPLINNKPIVAVTTSKSGDLLVATANDAWSCNIDKKACTKLCSAPEGLEFKEIGYNPDNGSIFFVTRDGLAFHRKPDFDDPYRVAFVLDSHEGGSLFPVRARRVDSMDGVAFSPQGDLLFGSEGDLWQGSVGQVEADIVNERRKEKGEPPLPSDPGEPPQWASLTARRCAPLANLETSPITPVQVGVHKVAISSGMVYVHLLRMYGTGFGEIVRLPVPPRANENAKKDAEQLPDGFDDRIRLYTKETSSVESLAENESSASYLCASLDGKRVFFRGALHVDAERQGVGSLYRFYLVENNGRPRELKAVMPQDSNHAQPTPTPTATGDYMEHLNEQISEMFPSASPRATRRP